MTYIAFVLMVLLGIYASLKNAKNSNEISELLGRINSYKKQLEMRQGVSYHIWALNKLLDMDEKIADIITSSSLWNCGKDSHNALSELTISISDMIKNVITEEE